jgi:hypothetical protein
LPNGLILQWGNVEKTSSSWQTVSVTFHKPLSSVPVNIQIQMMKTADSQASYAGWVVSGSLTANGFSFRPYYAGTYYWSVIGW